MFDGIHKGHQNFEVASKASMKDYLPVVVMTFTRVLKTCLTTQPELMLHIINHGTLGTKIEVAWGRGSLLASFSKFASLTG